MRPSQRNKIFFEQGNIAEASRQCGRATVIVQWRAAILAAGVLRLGRSRAEADWSASILAAVTAGDCDWFEVFLGCGSRRPVGTVM